MIWELGHGSADFFWSPLAVMTGKELTVNAKARTKDDVKTKPGERNDRREVT
jgi:hypothetical protein